MAKKIILISMLISIFLLGYSKMRELQEERVSIPILKVGISPDYPPFEYIHNGKVVGFDVDLVKVIANRLGYELKIIEMDFAGIIMSVKTGKIDLGISNISINEQRKKNVDFSDPYYEGAIAAVSLKNLNISSTDHLVNKAVGVQIGSTMEEYIKNHEISSKIEIKTLSKVPQLLQDLKLGRVDVVLLDQTQIEVIKSKMPQMETMILSDTVSKYAIALQKNSNLTSAVNEVIATLQKDGLMMKLEKKWLK